MAATPLHPEALAPTLSKAEKGWTTRVYPVLYRSSDNQWASAWPDRYPVEDMLKKWEDYKDIGQEEDFFQEYLCQAVDPASHVFTEDMFRTEPRVRTWHPVYAVYDPARTTNRASATTGKCVASWIGRELVIWESSARKWMPDQIIKDIFETNEKYSPIAVGVEEDGLNEWLMQPIRTRQVEVGSILPLRALQAPRGKLDFIRGLQPYFRAGGVVFAGDCEMLRSQLLGFPTGHIDAPNALAYMMVIRQGIPIYDNFREEMIEKDLPRMTKVDNWLLVNSNNRVTTGMLVQHQQGRLCILADAVLEGDPGTVVTDLVNEVCLKTNPTTPAGSLRLLASQRHFDEYSVYGLRAALKRIGSVIRGGNAQGGREEVRAMARRIVHGRTAISVCEAASWTVRAFAGGFARDADKSEPLDNAYAVLMEPLEAFAAMTRLGSPDGMDKGAKFAYTSDGRRFITALAR